MPFAVCMKSKSHQGSCILSSDPPPRGGPRPPLQPGVLLGTCQTRLASGDAWAALPSSGSSSSRRRGTEWGVRGLEPSLGAGRGVRRGMSPESGPQPPAARGELSSDAHSGQSWPASQVWALAGAHTVAVLERRYLHVSGCAVFGGFSHSAACPLRAPALPARPPPSRGPGGWGSSRATTEAAPALAAALAFLPHSRLFLPSLPTSFLSFLFAPLPPHPHLCTN